MTKRLFLSPRQSAESTLVQTAAIRSGFAATRLHSYEVPEEFLGMRGAYYGETMFGYAIAPQIKLDLLEAPHDWLPNLPYEYVKREVQLEAFGAMSPWLGRRFIKPAGEKSFLAGVYESAAALERFHVNADEMVLVAEPITFTIELRAFVSERRVVAIAPYARAGAPETTATDDERRGASELLQDLLADPRVDLPAGIVVDVGLSEHGWCVVESNPAWGSALYGCAAGAALPAIVASCGI
jgi:hypothetical protein